MDLANSIHMPDDIEPHHLIGHRPGHIDMVVGETETGMTEVGMIDTEGEAIEVVEIGAHNGIEVLQGVDHHQGTRGLPVEALVVVAALLAVAIEVAEITPAASVAVHLCLEAVLLSAMIYAIVLDLAVQVCPKKDTTMV